MNRYIEGEVRSQGVLLPERLDGRIADDNPVCVIDVFVDEMELGQLQLMSCRIRLSGR